MIGPSGWAGTVLSQYGGEHHAPHMMGNWWWVWIMWIGGFLVLVLVILAIAYVFRNERSGARRSQETPLDILKTRYAKGEITREQFEQSKKDLEG